MGSCVYAFANFLPLISSRSLSVNFLLEFGSFLPTLKDARMALLILYKEQFTS